MPLHTPLIVVGSWLLLAAMTVFWLMRPHGDDEGEQ